MKFFNASMQHGFYRFPIILASKIKDDRHYPTPLVNKPGSASPTV